MALVDAEVRGLKPEVRQYAKGDGRGLRLVVTPAGSKIWQFCFRWNGKVTTMALGQYLPGSLAHRGYGFDQIVDALEKRDARAAATVLEELLDGKIGRASCRERVSNYV